jgi:RHS repeat-associated protein
MPSPKDPDIFEVPEIQSQQLTASQSDKVQPNVNLFRGEVELFVPLVNLDMNNGLSVKIAAQYGSNVGMIASNWNLDAPTGILGMGWTLPLERIHAEYSGSASWSDVILYYVRDGVSNRLYRSLNPWQRGELPISYRAEMDERAPSPQLISALAQQGLAVSAEALIVAVEGAEQWTISDPLNELELNISATQSRLIIYDGGYHYELQSFTYSRISYYPRYERWSIVDKQGITSSFGGGVSQQNDEKNNMAQSIEWAVKWGNWHGASIVTHHNQRRTQQQYPISWYLTSSSNSWGQKNNYYYQQTRQSVGADGLSYTKAIYLSRIVDCFSREVRLSYADKIFEPESASGRREYMDANKSIPNNVPDAFQSKYESKYLNYIEVVNEDADLLYTVRLGYRLDTFLTLPENASPLLRGNACKRLLTSVVVEQANGAALPAETFDYCSASDPNPGALRTHVYPEGATVCYFYEKQDFPENARTLRVDSPVPGSEPRIWFGQDYAVLVWYNGNDQSGQISVTVYTWCGRWIAWRPAVPAFGDTLNLEQLQVHSQNDFFTLSWPRGNGLSSAVYAYHRDNRILGNWLEYDANPVVLPTMFLEVTAGSQFFVLNDYHSNIVTRFTWDNLARRWQKAVIYDGKGVIPGQGRYWLAASGNILFVLKYDITGAPGSKNNHIDLHCLSEDNQWRLQDSQPEHQISIAGTLLAANFALSCAPWVCAASYVTHQAETSFDYALSLFTWDEHERFNPVTTRQYRQLCASTAVKNVAWVAQVTPSGLIASGPNLLRYTGVDWLENSELQIRTVPDDQSLYWFAIGNDLVLKCENTPDRIVGMAQVFDPNTTSSQWLTAPISLYDAQPAQPRLSHYYPTVSNDFVSFNTGLYYRGASTDWVAPLQMPLQPLLPANASITSLINQAPGFMVWLRQNEEVAQNTQVYQLSNGTVQNAGILNSNFYQLIDAQGQMQNRNGQAPSGPDSFVTFSPMNAAFSQASSLFLHRYLRKSLSENLSARAVYKVEIQRGMDTVTTYYDFDAASASVDSSGTVAKFYQVSSWVEDKQTCGYETYRYFNGIAQNLPGENPRSPAVLDGLLIEKIGIDAGGQVVSSEQTEWQAQNAILLTPQSTQESPINGAFVLAKAKQQTLDGVSTRKESRYDMATGEAVEQQSESYNVEGVKETRIQTMRLGCQAYPELFYANVLSAVVQTQKSTRLGDAEAIIESVVATTWQPSAGPQIADGVRLAVMAVAAHYRWLGGEEPPDFNFIAWRGDRAPPYDFSQFTGWLCQSRVGVRSAAGLVLETEDVSGNTETALYDARQQYQVARIQNASSAQQECSYYGFERYEDPQCWQPAGGAGIVSGDCYTGNASLRLISGGSLRGVLSPQRQDRTYVLGFWYCTADGFSPAAQAGWQAVLRASGGETVASFSFDFAATQGEWRYGYLRLDLAAYAQSGVLQVVLEAINATAQAVLLDNVRFVPAQSRFAATAYSVKYRLRANQLGAGTMMRRYYYDRYNRSAGTSDDYLNAVSTLTYTFLSRQAHAAFAPGEPNQSLTISALGGGEMTTFSEGETWRRTWQLSGSPEEWRVDSGQLSHINPAQSGSLSSPQQDKPFALSCELFSVAGGAPQSADDFTLSVGEAVSLKWSATAAAWRGTLAGQPLTPVVEQSLVPQSCLLICSPSALLFYANNQLIFSATPGGAVGQRVTISTGKNALGIQNLALVREPKFSVVFQDGAAYAHQYQTLFEANALVRQAIYSARGQRIVVTKNGLARFGSVGMSRPLMRYNPDFVQIDDFLTHLDSSGAMQGEISQYYNGENGVSDDLQYPYLRNRLEASPLARVVEVGKPGKRFAIADMATTPEEQRHTLKYRYGNNGNIPLAAAQGLPDKRYFVQVQTSPLGVSSSLLLDSNQNEIIRTGSGIVSKDLLSLNAEGRLTRHAFPNQFADSISQKAAFFELQQYDRLERRVRLSHPDMGEVNYVYNAAGLIRFMQDAQGASAGYYVYFKYDGLNRLVEKGIYSGPWQASVLRGRANQPQWPQADAAQRIQKTLQYVGYDNGDINGLGKVEQTRVFNALNTTVSQETLRYDSCGRVEHKRVQLTQEGQLLDDSTTSFSYTFGGKVSQVIYPKSDRSGFPAVCYQYDELERVVAIGSPQAPQLYQSFRWAPDDNPLSGTLNAGLQEQDFTYYSPGWLQANTEPQAHQGFEENILSRYDDGKVQEVESRFSGESAQGLNTTVSVSYDELNRVTQALCQQHNLWDLRNVTYDPNGNTLSRIAGGQPQQLSYVPGSDKIASLSGAESADWDFTYTASGAVKTVSRSETADRSSLTFDYVAGSLQVASISLSADDKQLQFAYGNKGLRVMKQLIAGDRQIIRRIYLFGLDAQPLSEVVGNDVTHYVYGPQGLVAFFCEGQRYAVIKDHLGSVRLVQDSQGLAVAQFTYDSFGRLVGSVGNTGLLRYRYTGQEWDEETGLYNYRARFYSPLTGTFYAVDPKNETASPYLYTSNDPFDYTDPTGESLLGDIFSWIGQVLISTLEIVAAVALDVVTDGAAIATPLSGALLGAGLSTAAAEVGAAAQHKSLSWADFGENQAVGAVSGAFTSGVGSLAEGAGNAVGTVVQSSLKGGVNAVKAANFVTRVGVEAVGSTLGAVTGKMVENGINGNNVTLGLTSSFGIGLVNGVTGSLMTNLGKGFLGAQPTWRDKWIVAGVTGAAAGGTGALVANGLNDEKVNGVNLEIAFSLGAVGALVSVRPNARFAPDHAGPTVERPAINDGDMGNRFITNDML